VRKAIIALLALALALHVGFGCGMAQAATAIKAPCCGANCPVPSSAGDRACCHVQDAGTVAEVVSGKPILHSLQPLAGSIHFAVVMPTLSSFERASVFQNSPPGATKLALLCSRQI
jgi:hypothetical protein